MFYRHANLQRTYNVGTIGMQQPDKYKENFDVISYNNSRR
jgi:hypothetical protein